MVYFEQFFYNINKENHTKNARSAAEGPAELPASS